MIITNGLVFSDAGEFRSVDIEVQNGIITDVGEKLSTAGHEIINAQGCYVVPGLVDIHTHGAMGADFCDAAPPAIEAIAKYQLECGVTSFLGTTMTLPEELIMKICRIAAPYVNEIHPGQAVLRGIHLEGPFIGYEKRGAQNADYIQKPDYLALERFNEASGDAIRLIVVAPEVDGGLEFIKEAAAVCTVSLAHSSSNYEAACKAFSCGANHVTHLFNGMNPFTHREPGIAGAAFDADAYVELITDGVHIHPAVIRAVFKLFGENRVCLISDAMRACGLSDGHYELGGQTVSVTGRSSTLEGGSLAGSVTNLADCMRLSVEYGVPLSAAVKAATINPAKSVGIDKHIGSLSVGKQADILILDKKLNLKQTFLAGQLSTTI